MSTVTRKAVDNVAFLACYLENKGKVKEISAKMNMGENACYAKIRTLKEKLADKWVDFETTRTSKIASQLPTLENMLDAYKTNGQSETESDGLTVAEEPTEVKAEVRKGRKAS